MSDLRLPAVLTTALLLATLLGSAIPAAADWIRNDILTGNGQASIELGETIHVAYWVAPASNDGQQGCNADDGTPTTLKLLPSGPGAVPDQATLTFTSCNAPQVVGILGAAAGNWHIDLAVSDAGAGSFGLGGAVFMLHVRGPPEPEPEPETETPGPQNPVDTTAPVITGPGDLTLEATGPGGAEASWTIAALDETDGAVAATCDAAPGTFALGTHTVTCSATDAAGNTATWTFTITVQDTTPPALTLPASSSREGDTLGGAIVSWSASASDVVDGALDVTCDATSGALYGVGTTTVTCSATDAAGNTATGSFDITVTDTTPPALTLPASWTEDATSGSGASPTYAASAYDIVDGDVAVSCSSPSGAALPLGANAITCSATDASGNTATGSFTITVWLNCNGPLAPIKLDGGKTTFRFGSTIPIKCQPTGGSAGVSDATIRLTIQQVNTNAGNGDITPTTSTSAADTGNVMRWSADGQQYIYNLATKPLGKGTWRITMDLGGGQTKSFLIGLR